MNKKLISALLIGLMSLVLVACGSQNSNEEVSGSESSNEGESITLKFAGMAAEDHPSTVAMNKFAKDVEEKTEGRVKVKVFPANQLGDWTAVYDEISRGTIEMGLITHPTEHDPRAELFSFPYVATSFEDVDKIYNKDSYIFKLMQDVNKETDIKVLGFFGEEFGGIGAVNEIKNVTKIGEDKDTLVRTPSFDVQVQMMSALGYQTTTIPFADLYTSLQTGVADAWIGGGVAYNYLSFRDVINYYYRANTHFIISPILINNSIFDKVSEEDRLVIEEAAQEVMFNSFEEAQENEEKYLKLLADEGIEIIEFTPEERKAIVDFAREEMWPQFADRVGEETMNDLLEFLKSIE